MFLAEIALSMKRIVGSKSITDYRIKVDLFSWHHHCQSCSCLKAAMYIRGYNNMNLNTEITERKKKKKIYKTKYI